jgi:DNA-binding NarL/FixJ family response regulator
MATRTTAIVAEKQNFYNAGLTAMLQREVGFAEVIRAHDHAALEDVFARGVHVDFLALDLELPGSSGLATISKLHEGHPAMRMAVFSERTEQHEVLAILASGAHGFIPKQMTDCAELLHALRIVDEGGIYVPSCLLEKGMWRGDHDNDDCREALAGLTTRQRQVIKLLSEGHANKVIARQLGISPSTVKVHVHAAFRALGVHSRLAALVALRPTRPQTHEPA